MSEPCNCDGSGTTPSGYCRWCNAGEALRQAGDPIPTKPMDDLITKTIEAGVITERYEFGPPFLIIDLDHKDTTEPHDH